MCNRAASSASAASATASTKKRIRFVLPTRLSAGRSTVQPVDPVATSREFSFSHQNHMAKQKRATVVIQPRRADLRVEIDVFDVNANRLQRLGVVAGPSQNDIDQNVRQVKNQLERSGCVVSVKEM